MSDYQYMQVIDDRDGQRVHFIGQLAVMVDGVSRDIPNLFVVSVDGGRSRLFCNVCGATFPLSHNSCPNCSEMELQQ